MSHKPGRATLADFQRSQKSNPHHASIVKQSSSTGIKSAAREREKNSALPALQMLVLDHGATQDSTDGHQNERQGEHQRHLKLQASSVKVAVSVGALPLHLHIRGIAPRRPQIAARYRWAWIRS